MRAARCWIGLLLVAFAMLAPAREPGTPPQRAIAITIDDLPWVTADELAPDVLAARHGRLMEQLDRAGVAVTGFVNEGKLESEGRVLPQRVRMLRDWLDRGHELGNHTHGHVDLHTVGLQAFQQDVLRGERQLRPLLSGSGRTPRWFRHPYLRAGQTPEERAALGRFLSSYGYRVAPVTVDNSDWLWAAAYRNVLDGLASEAARERTLARLRTDYVAYMLDKVDYFERQSQDLLGRMLPQIWLLHANELNMDAFAALVEGVQAKGYAVVLLEEAMRDPAYARGAEGYDGRRGPSWLHRWAMGEGRQPLPGEPATPDWVVALAGFDSE